MHKHDEKLISEILSAKELRTLMLKKFLYAYDKVVTLTLNIPGVHKRSKAKKVFIKKYFYNFITSIEGRVDIVNSFFMEDKAGYIYYLFVDEIDHQQLKKIAIEFEEKTKDVSQLVDIDVYYDTLSKVSRTDLGFAERKCLICELNAKECARSERHSYEELNAYIDELIFDVNNLATTEKYIVEDIIQKILIGNLKEKERITESNLATKYGVSRTIIRSSLNTLSAMGMIIKKRNNSTEIRSLSKDEIIQIADLRFAYEEMIYVSVVEKIDEYSKDVLSHLLNELEKVEVDDKIELNFWNQKFNTIIYALSTKNMLKNLYQVTNTLFNFIRFKINMYTQSRSHTALVEHKILLRSMIKGDVELVNLELKDHLSNAKENILSII